MAQPSSSSSNINNNNQNGNRGWFEGTMEVISGMAPRPSTPQPYQTGPRSMSAPNSPARPFSFPGINRLPSQDSLDRSIHNESGHGRSTAQIIRDLKSANASLSAKSASMEAQFMNQLSSVTKKMEEKDMEVKQYKKQLAHLEAYKAASDSKLRDTDTQLSKVKEESAFQRHTISDLKNQLYQLQSEMEDQEMEKRDDFEQLLADNQEMARQLALLQSKCNEYENALESKEQDQYYRRQLQESQGELESQRKRLSVTQVNLQEAQREKESLEEEHAQRVQKLEFALEDQAEQHKTRELDLRKQIESMEFTDSQVASDLKLQLEERDETIMELQAKMDQYADKAAELAASLAQAREDAENQEQYRRDEAEDLRILHDAQEEEITKLRKELDDARNEVELRDTELDEKDRELKHKRESDVSAQQVEELKRQLSDSQSRLLEREQSASSLAASSTNQEKVEKLEKELAQARESLESREDPGVLREMQDKLAEANEKGTRLEQELGDLQNEHKIHLDALQSSVDQLQKEKEEMKSELGNLQKQKEAAVSNLEETNSEFSKLKNHWEQKSGAALEADRLRKELEVTREHLQESVDVEKAALETMKEKLQESAAIEKAAQARVEELEGKLKEAEDLKKTQETSSREIERLQKKLEKAQSSPVSKQAMDEVTKENADLKVIVASWENGESSTKLKKQLRDAQIALVALDDEKKEMSQKHRELLSAVERKKEEIQRDSNEQVAAKEKECGELRKRIRVLTAVERNKDQIQRDSGEQLASKDQEINDLQKKLREVEESQASQISLSAELEQAKKRSKALESEIETLKKNESSSASVAASVSRSLPPMDSNGFTNKEKVVLEKRAEELSDEKDSLKIKLKDRDTTIAALVRSSMKLEARISTMENELSSAKSVQSTEHEKAEAELTELRSVVSALKEKEPQLTEDIATLKRELKLAKSDAKRFRKALQEDGTTGSEYRFQIAMLQKELEETAVRVEERDIAIENLVNQSISQDAHVKDLKTRLSTFMKEGEKKPKNGEDANLKAEVRRLQEESEIFAGQIIEQDEELEKLKQDLRARDEQISKNKKQITHLQSRGSMMMSSNRSMSSEEEAAIKKELSKVQGDLRSRETDLRARETRIEQLETELARSRGAGGDSNGNNNAKKVSSLQAELDELQEADAENRKELRALRRQLWDAKQAAGEANDLRLELAQAKYAFEEFKRTNANKLESTQASDTQELKKLQLDLDQALESKKSLEQRLAQQTESLKRLRSEAAELKNAQKDSDEAVESKETVDSLTTQLKERDTRIAQLQQNASTLNEEQVSVFQKEIETMRIELNGKTDAVEKLQRTLKDTEDALNRSEGLKLKLVGELSETKRKYSNLEKEAAERVETIPISEEDIALKSKNEALAAQFAEVQKAHKDLSTSHEALVKDLKEKVKEIDGLKNSLETISKQQEGSQALQAKLEVAKQQREASEKAIVGSYESKLAALAQERDAQVDDLRQSLVKVEGRSTGELTELATRCQELEQENGGLRGQFEIELQAKNQQIYALEHTLHAQEQTVESMRAEMDQLQSGMEHATEKRRGEVEEMQQEVMQIESRAMKQEREIIALKMQLQETKLENQAEVVRLKDIIVSMEKESPLARTVAELQNDDRMLEVRERLEQLKMRNTSLQEENLKLGGRLERSIIEIKSFEAEKQHAAEMEHENASLRRQVQGLEQLLSGHRPSSSSSGGASPSRTPVDKENNNASGSSLKTKERAPSSSSSSSSRQSKKGQKGLKGLFKRRSHGLQPDEIIKEEKEEDLSVTN